MKKRVLIFIALVSSALLMSSCTKQNPTGPGGNGTPQKSSVRGVVIRSDDLSVVPGVQVIDIHGPADTSKSDGSFKLNYLLTTKYAGTLVAFRNTFGNDTVTFTLNPGDNDSLSAIIIKADSTSQKTAPGSGVAASLLLVSNNANNIAVRGTGADESVLLTFEARDSLGIPVLIKTALFFSLQGGPGGGEYLFPASGYTDLSGRVSTRVTSGTKAGVLQVYAFAKPDTGNPNFIVSCSPVRITISGGLADSAHVSMWSDAVNYPIMVSPGKKLGTISIQLGDQFSNPPQPTAIYFTSNGGLISATSTTSSAGIATADLFGGAPYPAQGIDVIIAKTQGNQSMTRQLVVTASGQSIITVPAFPTGQLTPLPDGGYIPLSFDIKDVNGNPIAAGNSISVTTGGDVGGQIAVSGDVGVTTVDTRDTSAVHYNIKVADGSPKSGSAGIYTVTIAVTGPNGTAKRILNGYLQAPGQLGGGPTGTGNTASIVLVQPTGGVNLSIQGTGGTTTQALIFEGRDQFGSVVDQAHGSMMHFSYAPLYNDAKLTVDSAQMGPDGRAATILESGRIAGVVQVRASVTVGGILIFSDPALVNIHAGYPDQLHFTIGASQYNFPGLDSRFQTLPVTVSMADKFGNPPVPVNVYFGTKHGRIDFGGLSSPSGDISANLTSILPIPTGVDTVLAGLPPGFSKIYAQTQGENKTTVTDTVILLWTGAPIITKLSGPAVYNLAPGATDGPWTFSVTDRLGHPMSKGTTISVAGPGVNVLGQSSITMPDVFSSGSGTTVFTVTIQNANAGPTALPAPVFGILQVTVNHPAYPNTPPQELARGNAN